MRAARALAPGAALLALAWAAGCALAPPRVDGVPGVSPGPAVPWTPPPSLVLASGAAKAGAGPAVPLAQAEAMLRELTLDQVVDLALQNSPATRAAWADARAAAARYGSERGAWLPTVSAQGALTRADAGGAAPPASSGSVGGTLSYLLFDFGGRAADVDEARQTLAALNWTHSAAIQDRILIAQTAFFAYAGAKAILAANQASLAEAESSLAAAEARHDLGLATIADVLQARTARAQAQLDVQATEGQLRTTRGALAVSMGYPANVPCDVAIGAPEVPDGGLTRTVEELIDEAVRGRPDLQAARARAASASARARSARSDLWPTLTVNGQAGRAWVDGDPAYGDRYSGALLLNVPLFAGFSRRYDLQEARAEAQAAEERARGLEQQVVYEVFASHSDFQTAAARVRTARELLASAEQSAEVASGRYREGVGSMLDLLSAQRSLAAARAQQVNARLGWFTALARLARDAGVLSAGGNGLLPPGILQPEVER